MSDDKMEVKREGLDDICDLFNKYGSNKDRNGYLQVYHCLFNGFQSGTVTILAIGSSTESLSALRDYFINGKIVNIGSEITENIQRERIEYYECNPTNKNEVTDFMTKMDSKFDIIIDDSCNDDMHKIGTLRNMYGYLKEEGIYIIEELGVESKLTQCPSLVGCLCNHDCYFFAGIKNNMCVIQKYHINSKRKTY